MDVVDVKENVTLNIKVIKEVPIPSGYGKTVHIMVMQDILNPDKYYHWITQVIPGMEEGKEYYIKAQLHDGNRLSYVRKLDVIATTKVISEQDSPDAEDVILGLASY